MTPTSVIIATKDLKRGNRSLSRLFFQWVSLDRPGVEVLVMDGSNNAEHKLICQMMAKTTAIVHHRPQETLNLPALWNEGVRLATHGRILISGADFLYSPDFFTEAEKVWTPKRLVMCMTHELPNIGITERMVRDWLWNWPRIKVFFAANPKLANGIQYATKELFTKIPFDERLEKLGGMDNLQAYKCEREGYEPFWWEQKNVLHQWHPISRMKFDKQFNDNLKVISDYVKNGD